MQGRRVEPDENGHITFRMEPGDYCKVDPVRKGDGQEFTEEEKGQWWNKPYWVCCSPNGHGGSLANHDITEHEDGTITVSPSILIRDSKGNELWHGFLERGVWRSV